MSQPLQYQQGLVNFFGYEFRTDSRALIPRFETEFLVSKTLEYCRQSDLESPRIVDIGTGSGIVAISVAKALPGAQVTAIDISDQALELAQENATQLKVDTIKFIKADLLEGFTGKVDILLANLPYLPTGRIQNLDSSVKDFEPHLALDGGADGMELYRRLFKQIASMIKKPKLCVFEFDDGQEIVAKADLARILPEATVSIQKDASDFVRYIVLEFNPVRNYKKYEKLV